MSAPVLPLAGASLRARGLTAVLTVLTVALSVLLLVGVEKVRSGVRQGFENTISGADLVVGARTSPTNLLLYSIFHIGNATNSVSWETYEIVARAPGVAWTIPISLGDSHRGRRVIGTTEAFYDHYEYANGRRLELAEGRAFEAPEEIVLGAATARDLGYQLGDEIVVAHGGGDVSFAEHTDHPFTVVGVLKRTGTPIDRSLQVSLAGLEAVHGGGPDDHDHEAEEHGHDDHEHDDHDHHGHAEPDTITAFIVGLETRPLVLRLQRDLNTYGGEALTAIIPGLALAQLWSVVGVAEQVLAAIALFTVVIGLVLILTSVYSSLAQRRREMAVLRAVGARPRDVFLLMIGEAALLAGLGAALGVAAFYAAYGLYGVEFAERAGASLVGVRPGLFDIGTIAGVTLAASLLAVGPAFRAMRAALADGLAVKY
ncbi:MAG: ABC transporter permease [Pseudomonadota bacterium]